MLGVAFLLFLCCGYSMVRFTQLRIQSFKTLFILLCLFLFFRDTRSVLTALTTAKVSTVVVLLINNMGCGNEDMWLA